MTFLLEARIASLPLRRPFHLVDDPLGSVTLPDKWVTPYAEARSFVTVHWSAAPEVGLPSEAFKVEIPTHPPSLALLEGRALGNIILDAAHGLRLDEANHLADGLPAGEHYLTDGIFYVRFHASASAAEIFALDLEGNEIAGSRQRVPPGGGPMFFPGPGIFGLQSTEPISLLDCRRGLLNRWSDISWATVAEVAPSLGGIPAYERQSYLSVQRSALDALADRRLADALARAEVVVPTHQDLVDKVHRANPDPRINAILDSDFAKILRAHFAEILADPRWQFETQLDVPGGPPMPARLEPVPLLQLMALGGPVEAYVLGGGVSIPSNADYVPDAITAARVLSNLTAESAFPLPLVRIHGSFAPPSANGGPAAGGNQPVITFGRLTWPGLTPRLTVTAGQSVPPLRRDEHALCDVEIAAADTPMPTACYLVRSEGSGDASLITESEAVGALPKAFMVADVEPVDPPNRKSRIVDPEVKVPFTGPEAVDYEAHQRDEFGRWSRTPAKGILAPWPVRTPVVISVEAVIQADAVYVDISVSWDWTHRTPLELRFGIGLEKDDGIPSTLKPADGVPGQTVGTKVPLRLVFPAGASPDAPPSVDSAVKATVRMLRRPESSMPNPVPKDEITERSLLLRVPVGQVAEVFAPADRMRVAAVVDALEQVSGSRRSEPSVLAFATALDPRPPKIKEVPWQLVWSSRPDPTGTSRALLPPPATEGRVAGFTAWRAHEASLFDLVLTEQPDLSPVVERVREEDNMSVRLVLIRGLLDRLLLTPEELGTKLIPYFSVGTEEFSSARTVEVELPAGQTGLEFFLFTARSPNGVASSKAELADLRAVAVPQIRRSMRPALAVITQDDRGIFPATGTCLVVISTEVPFDADKVRLFSEAIDEHLAAEEIITPLTQLWPLTAAAARTYVADIDAVMARQPLPFTQLFLARPQPSWLKRMFTTSIAPSASSSPADEVLSPRSHATSAVVVPATKPTLTLLSKQSGGTTVWTVGVQNLPMQSSVEESQVLVEFSSPALGGANEGAATLASLSSKPLQVAVPGGMLSTRLIDRATLEVALNIPVKDSTVRIAGRDPAGRFGLLTLV